MMTSWGAEVPILRGRMMVEQRYVGGHDPPPFLGAHPGLGLAAAAAGFRAAELSGDGGDIAAEGRGDRAGELSGKVLVGALSPEPGDVVVAVEILHRPVAHGETVGPEQLVQYGHVVGDQCR